MPFSPSEQQRLITTLLIAKEKYSDELDGFLQDLRSKNAETILAAIGSLSSAEFDPSHYGNTEALLSALHAFEIMAPEGFLLPEAMLAHHPETALAHGADLATWMELFLPFMNFRHNTDGKELEFKLDAALASWNAWRESLPTRTNKQLHGEHHNLGIKAKNAQHILQAHEWLQDDDIIAVLNDLGMRNHQENFVHVACLEAQDLGSILHFERLKRAALAKKIQQQEALHQQKILLQHKAQEKIQNFESLPADSTELKEFIWQEIIAVQPKAESELEQEQQRVIAILEVLAENNSALSAREVHLIQAQREQLEKQRDQLQDQIQQIKDTHIAQIKELRKNFDDQDAAQLAVYQNEIREKLVTAHAEAAQEVELAQHNLAQLVEQFENYQINIIVNNGVATASGSRGSHWSNVHIVMNGTDQISVHYQDSLDYLWPHIHAKLKAALSYREVHQGAELFTAFPDLTTVQYTHEKKYPQKDGWSCGYRALLRVAERYEVDIPEGEEDNYPSEDLRNWIYDLLLDQNTESPEIGEGAKKELASITRIAKTTEPKLKDLKKDERLRMLVQPSSEGKVHLVTSLMQSLLSDYSEELLWQGIGEMLNKNAAVTTLIIDEALNDKYIRLLEKNPHILQVQCPHETSESSAEDGVDGRAQVEKMIARNQLLQMYGVDVYTPQDDWWMALVEKWFTRAPAPFFGAMGWFYESFSFFREITPEEAKTNYFLHQCFDELFQKFIQYLQRNQPIFSAAGFPYSALTFPLQGMYYTYHQDTMQTHDFTLSAKHIDGITSAMLQGSFYFTHINLRARKFTPEVKSALLRLFSALPNTKMLSLCIYIGECSDGITEFSAADFAAILEIVTTKGITTQIQFLNPQLPMLLNEQLQTQIKHNCRVKNKALLSGKSVALLQQEIALERAATDSNPVSASGKKRGAKNFSHALQGVSLQLQMEQQEEQQQEQQIQADNGCDQDKQIHLESVELSVGMIRNKNNLLDRSTYLASTFGLQHTYSSTHDTGKIKANTFWDSLFAGTKIDYITPAAAKAITEYRLYFRFGLVIHDLPEGFFLMHTEDKQYVLCFDLENPVENLHASPLTLKPKREVSTLTENQQMVVKQVDEFDLLDVRNRYYGLSDFGCNYISLKLEHYPVFDLACFTVDSDHSIQQAIRNALAEYRIAYVHVAPDQETNITRYFTKLEQCLLNCIKLKEDGEDTTWEELSADDLRKREVLITNLFQILLTSLEVVADHSEAGQDDAKTVQLDKDARMNIIYKILRAEDQDQGLAEAIHAKYHHLLCQFSKEQINSGLIPLIMHSGAVGVQVFLEQMEKLDKVRCFDAFRVVFLRDFDNARNLQYETFLSSENRAAIDAICQLPFDQLRWWVDLTQQHVQHSGYAYSLTELLSAFQYFYAQYVDLTGNSTLPREIPRLGNLQVGLRRYLDLLANAKINKKVQANNLQIDLSADGLYAASVHEGFRFVCREMGDTKQKTYKVTLEALFELLNHGDGKSFSEAFYRYLATKEHIYTLEKYKEAILELQTLHNARVVIDPTEFKNCLALLAILTPNAENGDADLKKLVTGLFQPLTQQSPAKSTAIYKALLSWAPELSMEAMLGIGQALLQCKEEEIEEVNDQLHLKHQNYGEGFLKAMEIRGLFSKNFPIQHYLHLLAAFELHSVPKQGRRPIHARLEQSYLTDKMRSPTTDLYQLLAFVRDDAGNTLTEQHRHDQLGAFLKVYNKLKNQQPTALSFMVRSFMRLDLEKTNADCFPDLSTLRKIMEDVLTTTGDEARVHECVVRGVVGGQFKHQEVSEAQITSGFEELGLLNVDDLKYEQFKVAGVYLFKTREDFEKFKQEFKAEPIATLKKFKEQDFIRFAPVAVELSRKIKELIAELKIGLTDNIARILKLEGEKDKARIMLFIEQQVTLWIRSDSAVNKINECIVFHLKMKDFTDALRSIVNKFSSGDARQLFQVLVAKGCDLDQFIPLLNLLIHHAKDNFPHEFILPLLQPLTAKQQEIISKLIALLFQKDEEPCKESLFKLAIASSVEADPLQFIRDLMPLLPAKEELRNKFIGLLSRPPLLIHSSMLAFAQLFAQNLNAFFAEAWLQCYQNPQFNLSVLEFILTEDSAKQGVYLAIGLLVYAQNPDLTPQEFATLRAKLAQMDLAQLNSLAQLQPFPSLSRILTVEDPGILAQTQEIDPWGTRYDAEGRPQMELFAAHKDISQIPRVINTMADLRVSHRTQPAMDRVKRHKLRDYVRYINAIGFDYPLLIRETGASTSDGTLHSEFGYQYPAAKSLRKQEIQYWLQQCRQIVTTAEDPEEILRAQLLALALVRETIYRVTGIMPYTTQLLSVLNFIVDKGHLLSEIKTGEGKTITSTLFAVILWLQGGAVNVCTTNTVTSHRDYSITKDIYTYLGIENTHLRVDSKETAYCCEGINYAALPDLALYEMRCEFYYGKQFKKPQKKSLLLDEVDLYVLGTPPTDFRFAVVDGVQAADGHNPYVSIYKLILDFIRADNAIFWDPTATRDMDTTNMIAYALRNAPLSCAGMVRALQNNRKQWDLWIDSALAATALVHHQQPRRFIVETMSKKLGKVEKQFSTAIILDAENRPLPDSRWSNGVHQFVNLLLESSPEYQEEVQKGAMPPFIIEQEVSAVHAKTPHDVIAEHMDSGGYLVGISGSVAAPYELQEMQSKYRFKSITAHPTHLPNQRIDHAPILAHSGAEQFAQIVKNAKKELRLGRPVLIDCPDAAFVARLKQYFHGHYDQIQTYTGTKAERGNLSKEDMEAQVVERAGQTGMLTLSTIISRAADVKAENLHVIEAHIPFERKYIQFLGRTARQGRKGTSITIINGQTAFEELIAPGHLKTAIENKMRVQAQNSVHQRIINEYHGRVRYQFLRSFLVLHDNLTAADEFTLDQELVQQLKQFLEDFDRVWLQTIEEEGRVHAKADVAEIHAQCKKYLQHIHILNKVNEWNNVVNGVVKELKQKNYAVLHADAVSVSLEQVYDQPEPSTTQVGAIRRVPAVRNDEVEDAELVLRLQLNKDWLKNKQLQEEAFQIRIEKAMQALNIANLWAESPEQTCSNVMEALLQQYVHNLRPLTGQKNLHQLNEAKKQLMQAVENCDEKNSIKNNLSNLMLEKFKTLALEDNLSNSVFALWYLNQDPDTQQDLESLKCNNANELWVATIGCIRNELQTYLNKWFIAADRRLLAQQFLGKLNDLGTQCNYEGFLILLGNMRGQLLEDDFAADRNAFFFMRNSHGSRFHSILDKIELRVAALSPRSFISSHFIPMQLADCQKIQNDLQARIHLLTTKQQKSLQALMVALQKPLDSIDSLLLLDQQLKNMLSELWPHIPRSLHFSLQQLLKKMQDSKASLPLSEEHTQYDQIYSNALQHVLRHLHSEQKLQRDNVIQERSARIANVLRSAEFNSSYLTRELDGLMDDISVELAKVMGVETQLHQPQYEKISANHFFERYKLTVQMTGLNGAQYAVTCELTFDLIHEQITYTWPQTQKLAVQETAVERKKPQDIAEFRFFKPEVVQSEATFDRPSSAEDLGIS